MCKYIGDVEASSRLEEFPAELAHSNLMSEPDIRGLKSYYSVEQVKEQMRGRHVAAEARTIVREALPQARINEMFEERVLYKGYWILPNDPVARTMH